MFIIGFMYLLQTSASAGGFWLLDVPVLIGQLEQSQSQLV